MNHIATEKAPKAIGAYSQAVEKNGILFVSGQLPIVPETGMLEIEDIKVQTQRSLLNIKHIIEAAGYMLEDVVKCQIFLNDINDFGDVNQIYGEFFGELKPARCAFEVSNLPKSAMIEIDAICVK